MHLKQKSKLVKGEKLTVSLAGITNPKKADTIINLSMCDWLEANGIIKNSEMLITPDELMERGEWIWKIGEDKINRVIQLKWDDEPVIYFTYN